MHIVIAATTTRRVPAVDEHVKEDRVCFSKTDKIKKLA